MFGASDSCDAASDMKVLYEACCGCPRHQSSVDAVATRQKVCQTAGLCIAKPGLGKRAVKVVSRRSAKASQARQRGVCADCDMIAEFASSLLISDADGVRCA